MLDDKLNTEENDIPKNFLISFADKRRKVYETQENDKNKIHKTRSNLSFLFYDTLPLMISSTIVFPLYRLKIILQTDYLRPDAIKVKTLSNAISSKYKK